MFFSKNNPFVQYELLDMFAKDINSDIELIENGGHFIKEDGYEKFSELLRTIEKC